MRKINKVFRTYQNGQDSSEVKRLQKMLNDGWTVVTQATMPASMIEGIFHNEYFYGYIEYILEKEVDE